jgi:hypothetical protein
MTLEEMREIVVLYALEVVCVGRTEIGWKILGRVFNFLWRKLQRNATDSKGCDI